MIRRIEGTNDKGHPDECNWTLITESEYNIIADFDALTNYFRVRFSIVREDGRKVDE